MSLVKLDTIQTQEKLNIVYRSAHPGPGGGFHVYVVVRSDNNELVDIIRFQKGPRSAPEAQHGVLDCDLLEMVRDRLKAFQEGDYACPENEHALLFVEEALKWMNKRVEDRIARQVLGTMEK